MDPNTSAAGGMTAVRSVVAGLLIVLGLAASGRPAMAAKVRTELGFAGYVVPGCWVPLRLAVSGGDGWTVEIAGPGYVNQYRVRPGERLECPVRFGEDDDRLEMRLLADGSVIARQILRPGQSFPGHLVLTYGLPGEAQRAVEGALQPAEPMRAAAVEPERLPGVALDYDGVTAVILEDPGPILSPAQVRAMRAWLAGGGRLTLVAPRPGEEGLLSQVLPEAVNGGDPSSAALPAGLGYVALLPEAPRDPGRWREILELTPYAQSFRLSPSRAFKQDEPFEKPLAPALPKEPAIVLAVWASLAGILGAAARRRPLLSFLIFTAAAGAAAFPLGRRLDARWQRGIGVQARAVVLPGGGGILAEYGLTPPAPGPFRANALRSPDWGARLALGAAGTGIYGGKEPTLRWRQGRTVFVSAADNGRLAGYLPAAGGAIWRGGLPEPAGALGSVRQFVYWDGRSWRQRDERTRAWHRVSGFPDWLHGEEHWLAWLFQRLPGVGWLVGRGSPPGLRLAVQGGTRGEYCWALPLIGEAVPR